MHTADEVHRPSRWLLQRHPLAFVLVTIAAWVAVNALWLAWHRSGRPLNMDEAGYLGYALQDAFAAQRAGLPGWLSAIVAPSIHAPLTTALTSLVYLAGVRIAEAGMLVVLGSGAATLLVTALLAERFNRPSITWLSVILTATAFDFLNFSRSFVFATPTAAVMIAAVYSLVRSRGLHGTRWSIAFGICTGLLPLTRTMAIAFIPILFVAAAAQLLASGPVARRQVLNGCATLVVAAAVVASWFVPNGKAVFGYLTSYGYGSHSAEYANGAANPVVSVIQTLANEYLVPHLALLALGWVLVAFLLVAALKSSARRWDVARAAVRSPLFPCLAVAAGGCLSLMSSSNTGSGFSIPLLAPAAIVASYGLAVAASRLRVRRTEPVVAVTIAVLCVVLATGAFDAGSPLATPRYLSIAGVGSLAVTGGKYLDAAYPSVGQSPADNPPSYGGQWNTAANALTTQVLDGKNPASHSVMFGFRGMFINSNVIQLRVLEATHAVIPEAQIDPVSVGDTVADYRAWIDAPYFVTICYLVTSAGSVNEFRPLVDTPNLERAAASLGMVVKDVVALPDGRDVKVWQRQTATCRS